MRVLVVIAVLAAAGAGYWFLNRDGGNPPKPADSGIASVNPSPTSVAAVQQAEDQAAKNPTPGNYLNLSLADYQAKRLPESIAAARQALNLQPAYAEAWNNICAAHNDLKHWDDAIQACQEAVRLKPDLQLAKNNLAWAVSEKAKGH